MNNQAVLENGTCRAMTVFSLISQISRTCHSPGQQLGVAVAASPPQPRRLGLSQRD